MIELRTLIVLLAISSCLYGCGQKTERLPAQSIQDIYEIAAEQSNIRSLIVADEGRVVAEKYYGRYSYDSLEHLRSATKSIMSMLIGIAIDKGFIESVDDPISKYISGVPEDKAAIKVQNLLNMTSGITWNEGDGYNDNNRMIDSGNPLNHMMSLPMANLPGSTWNYSTGDIHLLSVILTEATGTSTREFAESNLFHPLGIQDLKWQTFGDGYTSGGSRLQLKPMDMLKLGILCMNGGLYEGNRIISFEYLEESTDIQYSFNVYEEEKVEEGYGYGWWTINVDGVKAYMASGYGGQTIAVIPDHDLVIVVTHNWRVSGDKALEQQNGAQVIAKAAWEWKTGETLPSGND